MKLGITLYYNLSDNGMAGGLKMSRCILKSVFT